MTPDSRIEAAMPCFHCIRCPRYTECSVKVVVPHVCGEQVPDGTYRLEVSARYKSSRSTQSDRLLQAKEAVLPPDRTDGVPRGEQQTPELVYVGCG